MKELNGILDDSLFTSAGFIIRTTGEEGLILSVALRANPECLISLSTKWVYTSREAAENDTGEKDEVLHVSASPGDVFTVEVTTISHFEEFLEMLPDWTSRVKAEVLFEDKLSEEMRNFVTGIEHELHKAFGDRPDTFTEVELDEIRSKLSEFQERITALEAEKQITRDQASEIKSVVKDLAQAAPVFSKREWCRTAVAKLFQISRRAVGTVGQQVLIGGVKAFMEGKLHLPHF